MRISVADVVHSMTLSHDINLAPFLVIALGVSEHIHPLIDESFKEKEQAYYEAYQRSDLYIPALHDGYTALNQDKIKKVVGILQWAIDFDDDTLLLKLMKKGYKLAYNYCLHRRDQIVLHDFLDNDFKNKLAKNVYEETDTYTFSDIPFVSNIVVIFYNAFRENKRLLIHPDLQRNVEFIIRGMLGKATSITEVVPDEEIDFHDSTIMELFQEYELDTNRKKHLFEDIIGNLTDKEKQSFKKLHPEDIDKEEFLYNVARQGKMKVQSLYSAWVQYMGINYKDLKMNVSFTREDLYRLFAIYDHHSREFNLHDKKHQDLIIFSFLNLWAVGKEYELVKNRFMEDVKEEYYTELSRLKQELASRKAELFEKERNIQSKVKKVEQENHLLKKQNDQLQKEMDALKKQLAQDASDRKELVALRDYLFDSINQEETSGMMEASMNRTEEDVVQQLNDKKGAVIGGHPDWQKKLKDYLTQFVFIDVDDKRRNLDFLQNMEVVFVNTSYLSHAMYNKVVSAIHNTNVPLHFLNHSGNIAFSMKEMDRKIDES